MFYKSFAILSMLPIAPAAPLSRNGQPVVNPLEVVKSCESYDIPSGGGVSFDGIAFSRGSDEILKYIMDHV